MSVKYYKNSIFSFLLINLTKAAVVIYFRAVNEVLHFFKLGGGSERKLSSV